MLPKTKTAPIKIIMFPLGLVHNNIKSGRDNINRCFCLNVTPPLERELKLINTLLAWTQNACLEKKTRTSQKNVLKFPISMYLIDLAWSVVSFVLSLLVPEESCNHLMILFYHLNTKLKTSLSHGTSENRINQSSHKTWRNAASSSTSIFIPSRSHCLDLIWK